eukprot:TRINITY_DN5214_c0_g1_i2.p1 TRINITY_DN5214_c0_g1~~TRINITY_DN5214_c0_g1_i2.p1  ORF type:complete len:403 (+),score=42.20 TRINITY_DN5214_c0_g1_i2:193-1401(+)
MSGKWGDQKVAIKMIKLSRQTSTEEKGIEVFRKEAAMLRKLRHENIVLSHGICVSNSKGTVQEHWMIMELLPNNLAKYIEDTGGLVGRMPLATLLSIAKGIATGMAYLHGLSPKIIHRDLKPANILLDENLVPKIADFGVSREKIQTEKMTVIGTLQYMAPEISRNQPYNEKVDVFSFGLVLNQLVTGHPPFGHGLPPYSVMFKLVNENKREDIPDICPSALKNLISKCWHADPRERPSFEDVVAAIQRIERISDTRDENPAGFREFQRLAKKFSIEAEITRVIGQQPGIRQDNELFFAFYRECFIRWSVFQGNPNSTSQHIDVDTACCIWNILMLDRCFFLPSWTDYFMSRKNTCPYVSQDVWDAFFKLCLEFPNYESLGRFEASNWPQKIREFMGTDGTE